MKIAIRTDASSTRGSGHVMRCLCLADALSAMDHDVTFASIDLPDHLMSMVKECGHGVLELPDQSQSHLASEAAWADEAQESDAAASDIDCDLMIVDHYGLGTTWERATANDDRKLMVIDDLGRHHDCQLLLDPNFYRTPEARYDGKVPVRCRILIGPRFALLRPEFATERRAPSAGPVRRILVFVGGMDASDVTSHILSALQDRLPGDPEIDVVIGATHPRREAIEHACAARRGWTCHTQTAKMAQLLAASDLVIGSGGTNTWERMAVGVPALALCIAENQRTLLDECADAGLLYVPDDNVINDPVVLRNHVLAMIGNSRLRRQLSAFGMAMVDGLGSARVARAASLLEPVTVRTATSADSAMLLGWRNHESIRRMSRNSNQITPETHMAWFTGVLGNTSHSLLVGERSGTPMGCVRFDETGPDSAEISIYLAPHAIGTGSGSSLLAAAESWLAQNRPHIAKIHAEVLGGNVASTTLFEGAGYRPDATHYSKGLKT